MKTKLVSLLRRTANSLAGDRQYSGSIAMSPKTKTGDFGARVIVEFDDPVDGISALNLLGQPRWLLSIAKELGVTPPGTTYVEVDSEDGFDD